MSFTQDVKLETSLLKAEGDEARAELSALIQLTSSLSITHEGMTLLVQTENAPVSRCVYRLLRERFAEVRIEPMVRRKMNLHKNLVYILRVYGPVTDILKDLGIYSARGLLDRPLKTIVAKDNCARCYLRGAFMADGSVNSPSTSSYHLEIKAANPAHASFLMELLERFYIPSKQIERRGHSIVYVKAAEKIGDFLRVIGADQQLMAFENERISRDMSNNIQRLNNVDVANEVKSMQAAGRQLEDIQLVEEHMDMRSMDPKLKEVMELRRENPEATLNELAELFLQKTGSPVSKSGLKHRFVRIHELAEKIRQVEHNEQQ
ncbi:MAG: DNA-binding protein WhiA [Galactobacillus timonensis]|uniref:DNA-binding protein WhiA n=1 Tax=Galactobacillus timonensis TaxID=2041840 RepID=UPI0023F42682|nr:DNA-binding protein WhiA [Galactobacillus timonensis]MDY5222118.1 DNA-binding protein WhiA [Lachnospiraceae bacterium]MDY6281664.1 DNA-binding protein WhiA [Erysipelotrichaceae bacterium]MCI6068407.1 DNA-binding protein WhiA [Galactobacillus timonensis]MCI6754079.1 DNA-binding protein WhiA [Galactobacillus timonensis]MDD7087029.1 DNA-binding protein WhiA [Galactobacillus timonensis]